MPITTRWIAAAAVALALVSTGVLAGPLDPPAGPVAPTHKTLTEVEPRTPVNALPGDAGSVHHITAPGSYYLTGPIAGEAGKSGVKVSASNVTLDLNGFAISGVTGAVDGVRGVGDIAAITVRNGVISGWPARGVNLPAASHVRVQSITARGNSLGGLILGPRAVADDCHTTLSGDGFVCGLQSILTRCTAVESLNGFIFGRATSATDCHSVGAYSAGFRIPVGSGGCILESCSATSSSADGAGFVAFAPARFTGCVAEFIYTAGFYVGERSVLTDCIANGNGSGITAGAGSVITGCIASNNQGNAQSTGNGISVAEGSTVSRCTANGNSGDGATGGNGIVAGAGCTVELCTARGNGASSAAGHGILITGSGAVVRNCNTSTNRHDGIHISGIGCRVVENTCTGNGPGGSVGAGIRVSTSLYCVLDSNHCQANDTGLAIDAGAHHVTRNIARNNTTNFTIAPGNEEAPIQSASTATSPWANLQ